MFQAKLSGIGMFLTIWDSSNKKKRIAIIGFAMFTLFVVSSFTGSITASIVTHPPIAR